MQINMPLQYFSNIPIIVYPICFRTICNKRKSYWGNYFRTKGKSKACKLVRVRVYLCTHTNIHVCMIKCLKRMYILMDNVKIT